MSGTVLRGRSVGVLRGITEPRKSAGYQTFEGTKIHRPDRLPCEVGLFSGDLPSGPALLIINAGYDPSTGT